MVLDLICLVFLNYVIKEIELFFILLNASYRILRLGKIVLSGPWSWRKSLEHISMHTLDK